MPRRRCSGRIDEKQSTERPERLAAEILFAFLIEHDDALAGVGNFSRRDQGPQVPAPTTMTSVCSPAITAFAPIVV